MMEPGRTIRVSERHAIARGAPFAMMCLFTVLFLIAPLGDNRPNGAAAIAVGVILCIALGVLSGGHRWIVLAVGLPVSLTWFTVRMLDWVGAGKPQHALLAHLLGIAMTATILWALCDRLRRNPAANRHQVSDVVIVYMMLAVLFAQIYWIANRLSPHAFVPDIPSSDGSSLLYFSMVTLTCLGDNLISPANPYLRMLTALESLAGVLYLAIVVARLISSHISEPTPKDLG